MNLYQSCVSKRLRELDKLLGHKSPYKPEINYDMGKRPPQPIMDSQIPTKSHDYLPAWIRKYIDGDPARPNHVPNSGMVRRPDVVIVHDGSKPPTQDNIKQIVEIKFPGDKEGVGQFAAYATIAGSSSKVVVLSPDSCKCAQLEAEQAKARQSVPDWALEASKWILRLISRGRIRQPFPAPN